MCLKTSAISLKLYLSLPVLRVCFFKEDSLYRRLIVTCVSSAVVALLGETDFRKVLVKLGFEVKVVQEYEGALGNIVSVTKNIISHDV